MEERSTEQTGPVGPAAASAAGAVGPAAAASPLDKFEQYLLAEYAHIADAHFKMTETISEFFKQYLVIMAVPISIVGLILQAGVPSGKTDELLRSFGGILALVLFGVAFLGIAVMLYVVNLRLDALLYARTINAVRKHFYDSPDVTLETRLRMRVLPQSPQLPNYLELRYLGPVILAFALADTVYLAVGLWLAGWKGPVSIVLATTVFGALHFCLYYYWTVYRERQYLRSNIIGVDVDGVLNLQLQQFCEYLQRNADKKVRPADVTVIPVHECESLDVTRDDERKVFNDPQYWTAMPSQLDAAQVLRRLRSAFNMSVHIFTHRPWPQTEGTTSDQREALERQWRVAASAYWAEAGRPGVLTGDAIGDITKVWLAKHGFSSYDHLTIEKGSDEVADPRSRVKNRYYVARRRKMRFFVEDDARKAAKLAYVCDVVFLLDQPYNHASDLPVNVVRVTSWEEIYRHVRSLC